jgi:hypothetical protein
MATKKKQTSINKNIKNSEKTSNLKVKVKDFTDNETVALINFVSQHPNLYNPNKDGYKNIKSSVLLYEQFLNENGLSHKYSGK